MKYQELYDEFIKLFPEDGEFFSRLEEETKADRSDGMHIMFGMVVCPFLFKILEEDSQKTQKAFDFVEKMVSSGDDDIVNVAEVTILENLITEQSKDYLKFSKYLGKESLETINRLSHYFDMGLKSGK